MRILIADDEPVSRLRLERLLGKWGYEVTAVRDGEQAWQVLSGPDAPELAILDWVMPGADGVTVCRRVRALRNAPYRYLILLTSRSETSSLVEAMNAGADDYVAKPFEPHELEVRLRAGKRILELQAELIDAREELRVQATRDALTETWNRRAILETLDRELARIPRGASPGLGVVIADLDRFKQVNDAHGHLVGDEVLRGVVDRMSRQLRRYDALGRLGGEEFLILLVDCDREQLETAAERIRRRVAERPISTSAGPLGVTVSLGATWVPGGRKILARQLLSAADRALYAAKDGGRNRLSLAEPGPQGAAASPSTTAASNGPASRGPASRHWGRFAATPPDVADGAAFSPGADSGRRSPPSRSEVQQRDTFTEPSV